MQVGRLHVLTDFYFQQRFSHPELAQMALAGGADTVQFRQKHGTMRQKLVEAERTAVVCRGAGIAFIINDHVDLALSVDAPGVHVGQEDLPVRMARRLMGPEAIIGATVSTLTEALKAYEEGADYLGYGPVYPTCSKMNPHGVRGLDRLREVTRAVPVPVIAIAGITRDRVRSTLEAGAHGVAVMTAITTSDDPARATEAIREEIDAWLHVSETVQPNRN